MVEPRTRSTFCVLALSLSTANRRLDARTVKVRAATVALVILKKIFSWNSRRLSATLPAVISASNQSVIARSAFRVAALMATSLSSWASEICGISRLPAIS